MKEPEIDMEAFKARLGEEGINHRDMMKEFHLKASQFWALKKSFDVAPDSFTLEVVAKVADFDLLLQKADPAELRDVIMALDPDWRATIAASLIAARIGKEARTIKRAIKNPRRAAKLQVAERTA